jgi:hypothetical protein
MVLSCSVELPLKTVCLDVHVGLEEHKNVNEGWGGLSLFSIDDVVTVPLSVAIETQHLPMQTPLPCKVCTNLHWPHLREIWPIKHPFLLAPLHTSINVIWKKPKICRNMIVGMVFYFIHVCVGVGVPCVFFPTLALHGCLVLACNA